MDSEVLRSTRSTSEIQYSGLLSSTLEYSRVLPSSTPKNIVRRKHQFLLRLKSGCCWITRLFCRHPAPTEEEIDRNRMKRVEANYPASRSRIGYKRYEVGVGDQKKGAIQYNTKAAQLGDIAHFNLAVMYGMGQGVEKDEKKKMHHLEEAAIGGHPIARDTLARVEWGNGMYERAVKHFIIAANLGLEQSMEDLPVSYSIGNDSKELVSQEDLVGVRRAYHAAIDATKSPQREAAEMWRKGLELRGRDELELAI